MAYPLKTNEQRQETRIGVELPARVSIGSQLTMQGYLKDLSLKSAFIAMKSKLYLQPNDEIGFAIYRSADDDTDFIQGIGRISRIVVGEGLAIYFTKLDEASTGRLKELLKQ
jgi:hypothetical protein